MTQEEAVVRLGIDSSSIEQQSSIVTNKIENLGDHIGKTLSRRILHGILAGIGLSELVSLIEKPLSIAKDFWVKQIESLGSRELNFIFHGREKAAQEEAGRILEIERQNLHKLIEERDKAVKENRAENEKWIESYYKKLTEAEKAAAAIQEVRFQRIGGKDSITALIYEEQFLETQKKVTAERLKQAKAVGDIAKTAEAELVNEQARQRLSDNQHLIREKLGSKLKPLDDINARILEDQAAAAAYRNPASRGRLIADLRERQNLINSLASDMNSKPNSQRESKAEQLTDQMLGSLMSTGAFKVIIQNLDDNK